MTTLCSPLVCDQKDTCARYADEDRIERMQYGHFADFSGCAKINGGCPWYLDSHKSQERIEE